MFDSKDNGTDAVGHGGKRSRLVIAAGAVLIGLGLLTGLMAAALPGGPPSAPCPTESCGPSGPTFNFLTTPALVIGGLYVLAGFGVLRGWRWARAIATVLALLFVVAFTIGLGTAWIDPSITVLFLGPPLALNLFVLVALRLRRGRRTAGS